MGRENATTMMQPSSDQANTKARGCELPGDKTILPQLPLGDLVRHDQRTWRQRGLLMGGKPELRRLDIVKYQALAGSLRTHQEMTTA